MSNTTSRSIEDLDKAVRKLKRMLKERDKLVGICENIGDSGPLITKYFKTWNEYSGSLTYPVPAPRVNILVRWIFVLFKVRLMSARDAYLELPLWSGTYGAARKRLVQHLIRELSKEILSHAQHR